MVSVVKFTYPIFFYYYVGTECQFDFTVHICELGRIGTISLLGMKQACLTT